MLRLSHGLAGCASAWRNQAAAAKRPGAKARGAAPRGNELQPSGDCRRRASHPSRIAGATGMRHRWPAGDRPASQDQVKSGATHPMNSILKMAGLGLALLTAACNQDAATRSEEHTSELQSLMRNSYAVFCLKKNNQQHK